MSPPRIVNTNALIVYFLNITCISLHEFVVCEHFLNVHTPKQGSKYWQLVGGPLVAGAPPMVQPAQWLIRHCVL